MTAKQIENKEAFLELVYSISEERMSQEEKDKLNSWLSNKSDFFTAPASTKYHCNYEGGLCQHSLNVYRILDSLVSEYLPGKEDEEGKIVPYYSQDTIILVSLFHDISKANFYEKYQRNVKDESGKWTTVEEYRTKSPEDRFVFANHESTSEYMLRSFVKLTVEESMAIMHHHGGMGYDSSQVDMSMIFGQSGLTLLLHLADMIATYVNENKKYYEN